MQVRVMPHFASGPGHRTLETRVGAQFACLTFLAASSMYWLPPWIFDDWSVAAAGVDYSCSTGTRPLPRLLASTMWYEYFDSYLVFLTIWVPFGTCGFHPRTLHFGLPRFEVQNLDSRGMAASVDYYCEFWYSSSLS